MYHNDYDMESPSPPDLSLDGGPDDYADEMRRGREALIRLNKLKEVLQFLPKPDQLRNQIENAVCSLDSTSFSLSSLIQQIRALSSNARMPLPQRLSLGKYLELWSDKIKLEFQAVRHQLHTLFAVPPILIALGPLTPELWEDMLDEPAYDTYGKPIQLKQELLERRISEDLTTVETQRDYISRYLRETTLVDDLRRNSFETQTLETLHTIVEELQESAKSADHTRKHLAEQHEHLKEQMESSLERLNNSIKCARRRRRLARFLDGQRN
ncbi:hypothetical protein Q1695_007219 [Nippostrongylus brasiliensis]|nr:hypothetical protein Q1695_007219 [Nippostrongylus brasiliensis]